MANNDLFSSLISDIKSYTGKDPLQPWLRGIKTMRDTLSQQLLKEKLPRFLQKCAFTFHSDKRYKNDLRYLRVWIQLMDYVDDPRSILKAMESDRIGMKRALFYQAYALYFEKIKKFDEADKMYHLGVQNLAEPISDLHKSYEQFLRRMERHKSKRVQRGVGRTSKRPISVQGVPLPSKSEEHNENIHSIKSGPKDTKQKGENLNLSMECDHMGVPSDAFHIGTSSDPSNNARYNVNSRSSSILNQQAKTGKEVHGCQKSFGNDTVVAKFVDTAIVSQPEAEDACHHGLVDPTINMKEAMNAINSMFREPIDSAPANRKLQRNQKEGNNNLESGFKIFDDNNLDKENRSSLKMQQGGFQAHHEPFEIFIDNDDDDGDVEAGEGKHVQGTSNQTLALNYRGGSLPSAFVFLSPNDLPSEHSDDADAENYPRTKLLREDTVVRRFVGSAILENPEVENVCHHGLVEPTVNLKEAMDDINNMFGEPIDFVRPRRTRKQEKTTDKVNSNAGFSILADDDLEDEDLLQQPGKADMCKGETDVRGQTCAFSILPDEDLASEGQSFQESSKGDFFEQTICTKEAIDDINKMFGMPLDF